MISISQKPIYNYQKFSSGKDAGLGGNESMTRIKGYPSYLLTFITGSFGFQLSTNFNIALKSMHTIPYIVLSNVDIKNGHQSQYMKTGSIFKNAIFEN